MQVSDLSESANAIQFFRGTRGSLSLFFFQPGDRIRPRRSLNIPEAGEDGPPRMIGKSSPTENTRPRRFCLRIATGGRAVADPSSSSSSPLCRVAAKEKRETWARDKITSAPQRTRARMRPDIKIYYPRTCRSSSMNPFSPLTSHFRSTAKRADRSPLDVLRPTSD